MGEILNPCHNLKHFVPPCSQNGFCVEVSLLSQNKKVPGSRKLSFISFDPTWMTTYTHSRLGYSKIFFLMYFLKCTFSISEEKNCLQIQFDWTPGYLKYLWGCVLESHIQLLSNSDLKFKGECFILCVKVCQRKLKSNRYAGVQNPCPPTLLFRWT